MSTHPSSDRLDALAAGDDDPPAAAHVAACERCGAYVARLGAEVARFRAAPPAPAAFAERVLARARGRPRAAARLARALPFAAPALAAAAALALALRGGAGPAGGGGAAGAPAARAAGPGEAATRFKGGPVVALVRERDGRQERLSGEAAVRGGDRVRVEVSVDAPGELAVAFLGDDGSYVPLSPPAFVEAGTHYSADALRFDGGPGAGVVVAGPPAAVERARRTKRLDGVVGARIVDER
jgi:anti-sigma factor RsiW